MVTVMNDPLQVTNGNEIRAAAFHDGVDTVEVMAGEIISSIILSVQLLV